MQIQENEKFLQVVVAIATAVANVGGAIIQIQNSTKK